MASLVSREEPSAEQNGYPKATNTVDVLSHMDVLARLQSTLPTCSSRWRAFYSSVYGGIVRDPALMVVPVDDHMVHRGHAVFDTCNTKNDRAYGIDFHLDRLLKSADTARIEHVYTKGDLKTLVLATIAVAGRAPEGTSYFVRYWLSAGRGDFKVSPRELSGGGNFYVVVEAVDEGGPSVAQGAKEWVVSVPMKPKLLATMKSTNYLLNALVAMESEDKGGIQGILVDSEGNVAETAIGNVSVVDRDGVLRTPPFDDILAGTTTKRAFALAPRLVKDGLLSGIVVSPIPAAALPLSREVMVMGGGKIYSVVEVDGNPVGGGSAGEEVPDPGPVFLALKELLSKDMENGEFTDEIPFDQYPREDE